MEYINFGKAGLKVSRLAYGLGLRGQADEQEAQRVIERAIDLGINLIDCANIYSPTDDHSRPGRSEQILGRAILGKRDDVVITSKVASPVGRGPNDRGLARVHILREIDNSLRRLQTDYVDVYLVHIFDESTPLEETMAALDTVVQSGKARYVGCCNYKGWQVTKGQWIADSRHLTPFMCIQNEYSLLQRTPEEELFGVARDQGLGIMAYSPLAVGLLSGLYRRGKPAPDGTYWATRGRDRFEGYIDGPAGAVIEAVCAIADEVGKTPAQVALAWVLAHPEITCAITGGDTIAHLEDNFGALGWSLDAEHRARLDAVSAPAPMYRP
ncbi:MAG: aldo/keto reductase [Litorilinea sp.]